ncbi:MAG: IPT/TIG domain-containing protein, partial [Campylobacterales bacterium]
MYSICPSYESCSVTPYTTLVQSFAELYSGTMEQRRKSAQDHIASLLGIDSDPFVSNQTSGIDLFKQFIGSRGENIASFVKAMREDGYDGYLDDDDFKNAFKNGKTRVAQSVPVTIDVTELESFASDTSEESSDDTPVQTTREYKLVSFSSDSSADIGGSTSTSISSSGYLSDIAVIESSSTSYEDGSDSIEESSIKYLSFNIGEWKGKLNAETTTLSKLFMTTPELLFLPADEQQRLANIAAKDVEFDSAVAKYQESLNPSNTEASDEFQAKIASISDRLTSEISDSQMMSITANMANKIEEKSNSLNISTRALSPLASSSSTKYDLIPAWFRSITATTDSNSIKIKNNTSLYYALDMRDELENYSWWESFSMPESVDPSKESAISVEKEKAYRLYRNNENYYFDKPQALNTVATTAVILEAAAGVGKSFNKALKEAVKKSTTITETYQAYNDIISDTGALLKAIQMGVEGVCSIYDELQEGATAQNDNFKCEAVKKSVDSVVNAFELINGTLTASSEPTNYDKTSVDKIGRILPQLKDINKNKLTNFGRAMKNIGTDVVFIWIADKAIQVCFSGGKKEYANADNTKKWKTSSIARYMIYKTSIRDNGSSDTLYQTYGGSRTYPQYLNDGRNSMIFSAAHNGAIMQCLRSQLSTLKDFSKTIDRLSKVNEMLKKVVENGETPDGSVTWHITKILLTEGAKELGKNGVALLKDMLVSMTPAKALKLAKATKDGSSMAWDAVTKPSYVDFTTDANMGISISIPPLDQISYIAIPKDNVQFLVDTQEVKSSGFSRYWLGDTYPRAYTLSKEDSLNNILAMPGMKFSIENKVGLLEDYKDAYSSYLKKFSKDDDTVVTADWHSYRYDVLDIDELQNKYNRTKSTSFNGNNYIVQSVKKSELDCPFGGGLFGCSQDSLFETHSYYQPIDFKENISNPIINAYLIQTSIPTDKEMSFVDFTSIYEKNHKGIVEHNTPGIYTDSTSLVFGGEEGEKTVYDTALNVFLVPDYDYTTSNAKSHRDVLVEQSSKVLDKNGNIIAVKLALNRDNYFNFWGRSDSFPNRKGVDEYPFYVVTEYSNGTKEGPAEVELGDGSDAIVDTNSTKIGQGITLKTIYVYDTILNSYTQRATVSPYTIIDGQKNRKENGKLSRPFMMVTPSELKEFKVEVAQTEISSVSPTTANLDEATTFTITGTNLPETLAFTIADAEECIKGESSLTEVKFACTPRASGNKEYIIKDKSGGDTLESGYVEIGEISIDLPNGLVAYYEFEDNANDSSGHRNHGMATNSGVSYENGKNGKAVKFGGYYNPGHIKVPNSDSLMLDDEITVSAWIKIPELGRMDGLGNYKSSPWGGGAILAKDHDRSGFFVKAHINNDGNFSSYLTNNAYSNSNTKMSTSGTLANQSLN